MFTRSLSTFDRRQLSSLCDLNIFIDLSRFYISFKDKKTIEQAMDHQIALFPYEYQNEYEYECAYEYGNECCCWPNEWHLATCRAASACSRNCRCMLLMLLMLPCEQHQNAVMDDWQPKGS